MRRIFPSVIAIVWAIVAPAFAADQSVSPLLAPLPTKAAPRDFDGFAPDPVPAWRAEFGARFWFAQAKTGKSLYDNPALSNAMVSRLTYGGLDIGSAELFGRVSFPAGWFVKGYAGAGVVWNGQLQDEDFPPGIDPYSSTLSRQHNGNMGYASTDVGYDFLRRPDYRIGAFAGFHYLREVVSAYGCNQTATNPLVCEPAIPNTILGISQGNSWYSARVGLEGAVMLGNRLMLSAEGAWLPYVHLRGKDDHWLRIGTEVGDFMGAIPETGHGQGYQLEALLSYQLTQHAAVGIGARYWHMWANGQANFSGEVVGVTAYPQPVDWKNDMLGVFLQASVKLDPYPLTFLH